MISWAIRAENVNQDAKKWKRPSKSLKNKMFIFGLCSTPDDWLGWSMDSNPICHPSPARKIKCSFLDYIQLLMICQAGRRTWTLSTMPLQPKKWNAHFWIMFNFWWSVEQSKQKNQPKHLKNPKRPPKSLKNKMFVFGLHSTSDDQLSDPSKKCQPKGIKKKAP